MLIFALILFVLAALFGLIILKAILKNKHTPKPIVLLHGSAAILAILIIASYIAAGHAATLLLTSLVLFVLAALGGLVMVTKDVQGKPIPKAIALIHPLIGLAGLIVLIIYMLQ